MAVTAKWTDPEPDCERGGKAGPMFVLIWCKNSKKEITAWSLGKENEATGDSNSLTDSQYETGQ